ncbi:hypothetical protein [Albimonas pacifica]|uniref:Uncharacterized protein n=1 Tax=Albimonas pacifica TaxID=1114924 RepID=A0A1I3FVN3_9RHOB|nr:hypothetical protein [Albimonas pacifica]SFI15308.1 hypothetical protein SAMN05216258_104550 [Albimonas pacifica]
MRTPREHERHERFIAGLSQAAAAAPDTATEKWLNEVIRKEEAAFEATPIPYGFTAAHDDGSHPADRHASNARAAEFERREIGEEV